MQDIERMGMKRNKDTDRKCTREFKRAKRYKMNAKRKEDVLDERLTKKRAIMDQESTSRLKKSRIK